MSVFFDKPPDESDRPRERLSDPTRARRGPDFWVRVPVWLGIISWTLALVGTALAWRARPTSYGFLDRAFGVSRPLRYDHALLDVAFALMVATLALVGIGLFANARRLKRSSDKIRSQLIVVGVVTGFAAGWYLFGRG